MTLEPGTDSPAETAYYYPEPHWSPDEGRWLKTLLLFFDRIAILLPDYMYGQHHAVDPSLAGPLEERDLLVVLQPESFVDETVTDALTGAMAALLEAGAFDDLPQTDHYAELSRSRMGWTANIRLAANLVDALKTRGLARDTEDGVSIPLHPTVRTAILVLLSQLARAAGRRRGLDLHPITSSRERIVDLMRTLSLREMPTAGHVVSLDLETVTLNLETVSLEEVLAFRDEHRSAHRAYARSVRQAVRELSAMPMDERSRALADRRDELAEQAEALRRLARRRWRIPLARFSLGAAGATVSAATGNIPGAIITALGGILGAMPDEYAPSAYSYLVAAERTLSRNSP